MFGDAAAAPEFGDEILGLLDDGTGNGMELDWLFADAAGSDTTPGSPPRARPRLEADEPVEALPNLSDVSRSLATPAEALSNVSAVSRSFAGEEARAPTGLSRRRRRGADGPSLGNMSSVSKSLAHLGMTRQNNQHEGPQPDPAQPPPPRHHNPGLSNTSSLSMNLAHVGAVPQCNQATTGPPVPPPAVAFEAPMQCAEAVPLVPARVGRAASPALRGALDAAAAVARPAAVAAPAPAPVDEKLLLRRARNREAAERMRRRRREEHDDLQRQVKDLTQRLGAAAVTESSLRAELASARAEIASLKGTAAPGAVAVAGPPPEKMEVVAMKPGVFY